MYLQRFVCDIANRFFNQMVQYNLHGPWLMSMPLKDGENVLNIHV